MSPSPDWWPLCDSDPVPGDPGTLAALGGHMGDAAAEIERMATMLPRVCTSEVWDSDAGQAFREKAASTAAGIGRTHHRFFTVAQALGRSTYGGSGYAARLQEYQQAAAAALGAVNGTGSTAGSERERLQAWNLLLDATGGADPAQSPPAHGSRGTSAGPMPQASPGVFPPYLPSFPADSADVAAQKAAYNAAVGQLHASAQAVATASAGQSAAAAVAVAMVRTAIDNDGLNNPSGLFHWLEHAADDVGGFIASHWVQFVKDLATIAGAIATICGILAMVLAFIPGLQEFAALFETVALLAQAVAFVCHTVLAATGNGSWFDVIVDAVGLVTFGIGKGLIGSAEGTADVTEEISSVYRSVVDEGEDCVSTIIEAGDKAADEFAQADEVRLVAKMLEQMREVVSVRPVFSAAMKAWEDGKLGATLGEDAMGTLGRGFRDAFSMRSAEIGSAMSGAVEAAGSMTYAQGTAWGLTSRIDIYDRLFRIAQGTGIDIDLTDKLDQILNLGGLPLPGYDNLKSAFDSGHGG